MLMAAQKLKDIGLVLLTLFCAMMLYLFSTYVGGTRTALYQLEKDVARKQANIRYLESEIAVRSAMVQLERWNEEYFGYQAPGAEQYLRSERQLASLDRLPGVGRPRGGAAPVMALAMPIGPLSDTDGAAAPPAPSGASAGASVPRVATASLADQLSILPPANAVQPTGPSVP